MPYVVPPPKERILSSIKVDEQTGCWVWQANVFTRTGRPRITIKKKGRTAYRVAYEEFVGPIPDGLMVCHRCDNPLCVNPEHLFLGTAGDNVRDCIEKRRRIAFYDQKCLNGHPLTPDNVQWVVERGNRKRRCKTCNREKAREAYRRKAGIPLDAPLHSLYTTGRGRAAKKQE